MMLPLHTKISLSLSLTLALAAAGTLGLSAAAPAFAATAKPAAGKPAASKPAAKAPAKPAAAKPTNSSTGGPLLLGKFNDWYAYSNGSGASQYCYILSQPKSVQPEDPSRHDTAFFLISSWPGKDVTHEPSIVPGYAYKDETAPRVTIGADKFDFFSRNDKEGKGGGWLKETPEEQRLIATMKNGSQMSITGTSSKGVPTNDTYSLAGISAALQKMDAACK